MEEPSKPDPQELLAHAHDLRRLARALVSDPNAADDLAQDAWVEMLEGRARPDLTRQPTAWLHGLLRNMRRERARGEGRRAAREARVARPDAVHGEAEIVERLETFRALAREVEQLEEPYRTSIWRRFFVGETADEIAAREGISAATVRSHWLRALAKLRERLDRRDGGRERWMPALLLVAEPVRATRSSSAALRLLGASALLAAVVVTAHAIVPDAPSGAASFVAQREADEHDGAELASAAETARAALTTDAQVAVAPGVARSPLRLALVDDHTREPVPHALVRVRARDEVGEWTSDGAGRVTTSALPHGEVGVEVLDDPGSPPAALAGEARAFRRARPLAHDGRALVVLAVATGPTWELALDVPVGVAARDLPSDVATRDLPSGVAVSDLIAQLRTRDLAGARSSATARVRVDEASGRTWVRFAADGAALAGGAPWILRIATRDGRYAGESFVDALHGQGARPIEVRLAACAELIVRVLDAERRPLAARVEVRAHDGTRVVAGDTAGGELIARSLTPRPVIVRASAFGLPAREVRVDVHGAPQTVELVFDDVVARERIAGRVRLTARQTARVVLRDATGVELARTVTSDDPVFAFDDVPVADHELFAESPHVWRWDPPRMRVRPPSLDLELTAEPIDAARALVVRARDATTGAPLEHFDVRIEVEGARPVERSSSIGGMTLGVPPEGARVAWTLAAPGHEPARGDERAIRRGPERSTLDVELRRGFGLRACVVDDASGAALADVELVADGRVVARTDARGEADVTLREAPRTLDARLAGHAIAGGDVDPVRGWWRADATRRVEIRLARRP